MGDLPIDNWKNWVGTTTVDTCLFRPHGYNFCQLTCYNKMLANSSSLNANRSNTYKTGIYPELIKFLVEVVLCTSIFQFTSIQKIQGHRETQKFSRRRRMFSKVWWEGSIQLPFVSSIQNNSKWRRCCKDSWSNSPSTKQSRKIVTIQVKET